MLWRTVFKRKRRRLEEIVVVVVEDDGDDYGDVDIGIILIYSCY
jgi:hypothetical protein